MENKNIYTKSKTTLNNASIVKNRVVDENTSMKVSFNPDNVNLIIEYLTNLYADAPSAVARELFTNACDADPNGFINIYIDEDPEENTNTFTIVDKGVGMNKKQLTENYVQYANSSKTSEFDTVGSFGLGSKSPMAITSEYEVESCDGNKIYRAIVQRIESGIYANIDEIGEDSESYTKVIVRNVSNNKLSRMKQFLQYLANFSGRQIILNDEILNRSENYKFSFKVPSDIYPIRIFTPDYNNSEKMKMFISYFTSGGKCFNKIIRVNNTPYTVQKAENNCYGTIVIDVEPGYFSFAPSREDIPGGDKRDHILEIANKCVFNNVKEFISFISGNKFIEDKIIFNSILRRDFIENEQQIDLLVNSTKKDLLIYKDKWNVKNQTEKAKNKFADLFKDCEISIYGKTSFKNVRIDTINKNVSTDTLLGFISERINKPIEKFDRDVKKIEYVKLYTEAKKKRGGGYRYPSGYGVMNIAGEIENFVNSNYLFNRICDTYSSWNSASVYSIHIITSDSNLSREALEYLKFLNIKENDDGNPILVDVAPEKFNYKAKPSTQKVKTDWEDKYIDYFIESSYKYVKRGKVKVKDIVNEFNPNEFVVVSNRDFFENVHISYISYKINKKFIYFNYKAKKFFSFLEDNKYNFIDMEKCSGATKSGVFKWEWKGKNNYSKQFEEFINSDSKSDFIYENESDLVMSFTVDMLGIDSKLFKYLNFNTIELSDYIKSYLRSNLFTKHRIPEHYQQKIIEGFNSEQFFNDFKDIIINNEKYKILRYFPDVFKKYLEGDNLKKNEIELPIKEWQQLIDSKTLESMEIKAFKEKVNAFKTLDFFPFHAFIEKGLDMNNPIHKAIKKTMDKELKEFFA